MCPFSCQVRRACADGDRFNTDRTCVTTNLVGVVLVGLTGLVASTKRLIRRDPDPSLGTDLGDRPGASHGRLGSVKDKVTKRRQGAVGKPLPAVGR